MDWNIPKNITMIAVDDYADEDSHYGYLALNSSSESSCFLGLEVRHRQIIEDNDCAGLSIPSEMLVRCEIPSLTDLNAAIID